VRVLALVVIAGCGRIGFGDGTDTGVPGGDGSSPDSITPIGDGMFSGCVDPGIGDSFTGLIPCNPWGNPIVQNAGLNVSNGTLQVTPNANNANAKGGCTRASVPFGAAGVFVEVSQVTPNATTYISLTGTSMLSILVSGSEISPVESGSMMVPIIPYDPVAHRWWRIRPNGAHAIFEGSPDGRTWNTLYVGTTASVPATVTVEFGAQTATAVPMPGAAKFESIDVCP
jgi:hypothetical protein